MNPQAVVMMAVTIILVWGGLVASVVSLRSAGRNTRDDDKK